MTTQNTPQDLGTRDGQEWDLSGFRSREQLVAAVDGWDEATINAITDSEASALAGAPVGSDEYSEFWVAYNEACHRAAIAQWDSQ